MTPEAGTTVPNLINKFPTLKHFLNWICLLSRGLRLRYHVSVGMNSKEREEVLDLYKHISAGIVERKGIDRCSPRKFGK